MEGSQLWLFSELTTLLVKVVVVTLKHKRYDVTEEKLEKARDNCNKYKIKRRHCRLFGVFIVTSEQISDIALVFP